MKAIREIGAFVWVIPNLFPGLYREVDVGDGGRCAGLVLYAHAVELDLAISLPVGRYWTCWRREVTNSLTACILLDLSLCLVT